jgi:hypothetical protein
MPADKLTIANKVLETGWTALLLFFGVLDSKQIGEAPSSCSCLKGVEEGEASIKQWNGGGCGNRGGPWL